MIWQDRAPLEAEPPQIPKGMEEAATNLFEGKIEMAEAPGDPYAAQLAKAKAAKVQTAEKLLAQATKDPKVQKAIKKKSSKGKGRGRGKKSSNPGDVPGTTQGDCEDVSKGDGETHKGDVADDKTVPPANGDGEDPGHEAEWLEKETHITFLFF